jgi:membrane-associated phospholipid phosphatase
VDFEEQFVSPFKMNSKQWIMTGAAVGITAVLIHFDDDIDEWARVQKQDHKWVSKTSPVITNFGGDWGVYSVLAGGAVSAIFKNEKGVQTSLLATQAMITSGVWVNIIKIFTGRERPKADYTFSKSPGGTWYGPFAMYDQDLKIRKPVSEFDAFPSGHTATAFSIATVIATQYSDRKAIPIICYSAASLVGISRLTEHQHWASDVFVGGLMGYLCGKQVVKHFNKTHQNQSLSSKSKNRSEVSFIQYGNQFGVFVRW